MIKNVFAITNIIVSSSLVPLPTNADFCNKEFLEKTPAVLKSGCTIVDVHPLNDGKQCYISAENCTIPILNKQTNSIDIRKDLSLKHTTVFSNEESLKTLYVHVSYPYLYVPKPEQASLIVSTQKGKDGDFCNEDTLKKTPAVVNQKCKLHTFSKEANQCQLEYDNCSVQIFDPKTNTSRRLQLVL